MFYVPAVSRQTCIRQSIVGCLLFSFRCSLGHRCWRGDVGACVVRRKYAIVVGQGCKRHDIHVSELSGV